MFGVSETQRQNANRPIAGREGAYTARAVEIGARLDANEVDRVIHTGLVPQYHLDKAAADGFDEFLIARAAREHVTNTAEQAS